MKRLKIVRPCAWYALVAIPLAITALSVSDMLTEKSEEFRIMGALRPINVLASLQIAQIMGVFSIVLLFLFAFSFFAQRIHDNRLMKLTGLIALSIYCLWGLMVTMWIYMC